MSPGPLLQRVSILTKANPHVQVLFIFLLSFELQIDLKVSFQGLNLYQNFEFSKTHWFLIIIFTQRWTRTKRIRQKSNLSISNFDYQSCTILASCLLAVDAQLFDSFTANKFKFTPKQQLTEQGEPITMRQQPHSQGHLSPTLLSQEFLVSFFP